MALLFLEGFELYVASTSGGTAHSQMKLGMWDSGGWSNGSFSGVVSGGPYGYGKFLRQAEGSNGFPIKSFASSATIIVGMAYRIPTTGAFPTSLFELYDGATVHTTLRLLADGSLQVQRGTTAILTSAINTLKLNVWHFVELKITIHNTTGTFDLHVDGVSVLSGSSLDTQNGASAQVNKLQLRSSNGDYDDIYICDTSGSRNNDFLGPFRVETLMPSAEGTTNDFTPSTGTDNSANVDDATGPDDDTTYNSSSTAGHRDLYALGNLTVSGTPVGIIHVSYVRKDDAGSPTFLQTIRMGSTNYDDAAQAVPAGYAYYPAVKEVRPSDSSDWTSSDIDAMEAGIKLESV